MSFIRKFTYKEIVAGMVSRSQAKQIAKTLPKTGEVTLDFSHVTRMQQGFADEMFRVWPLANPSVKLVLINMQPEISKFVAHITGRQDLPQATITVK